MAKAKAKPAQKKPVAKKAAPKPVAAKAKAKPVAGSDGLWTQYWQKPNEAPGAVVQ